MKMTGSTETQFTATGPAGIGFQTQPPETNTQFEIGVDVSGLSIGVKGTGTDGERSPLRPGSGGTGVQGNGSGIGWGVAGFGGNATPRTVDVDPSACAGVLGQGGLGPQSGGPGVFGFGGPNSGVGVFGQGRGPGQQGEPGGPGVKGIGGASSNADNADGVQGFGSGTFSGVAGFGGGSSGTGVFGFGGGPGGPGVRGIGAGGPITVPSGAAGVYGQGGPNGDGVQGVGNGVGAAGVRGFGSFGVHAIAGPNNGDTAVFAEGHPNSIGIFASGGQAGFFGGDVDIFGGSLAVSHDLSVSGNLSVLGSKSAAVPFPDGSHRQLYCLESPDSWFEDFGFGRLTDGRARIQLDPDFATTVNTDGYHVFITEYDDNNGLFVTNRTNTGFEVGAKTSASEAAFSYRVVARRKDIAPARFAKLTLHAASLEEIKARLAKAG
jgi:hypothetical protein